MKITTIAPFGGPVDACMHRGRVIAAWQSGKDRDVHLVIGEFDPVTHARLVSVSIPLGDDVGAFVRLLSALDSVWCIYREGASKGGRAVLLRDGREVWRSASECGGNDPVCFGSGRFFAWQRSGDNAVFVAQCLKPAAGWLARIGAGTGLSHFNTPGDAVVTVDEARGLVPGITRPSWAGALVAGEHPDSGALIKASDGRALRFWPDEETVTPRLAHDPATGTYAVVTSGVRGGVDFGVRLATFTASELQAPAPPVEPDAPWPPGKGWTRRDDITEIPILRFMVGGQAGFSREGAHVPLDGAALYTHWMQSRYVGDDAAQVTKPNGHTTFTFDIDDGTIGIAYDGTNEIDGGYRIVVPQSDRTAPLWHAVMRVGEARRIDTPVEILTLATGARRAVTCRTWVEAVYDGPRVGDVLAGRYAVLGYTFDIVGDGIDGDPRGVVEYTLCREHAGPVAWFEFHRRLGTWRRWFGVRVVPRHPDPEPQFAHEIPAPPVVPPVTPPTPEPEPPPMPPTTPPLPSLLTLSSWRGLFLCAEGGGGGAVVADRIEAGPWETFAVVPGVAPGTVALRCHDGEHYLCAEDGGGGALVADRPVVGPWESWTIERHGDGVALISASGFAVCAEDDPIGAVNVSRASVGPWEVWTPTKTNVAGPALPAPVTTDARIRGRLRVVDGHHFADDLGPVTPRSFHFGEWFSVWLRDRERAKAAAIQVRAAGFDLIRPWFTLNVGNREASYWRGRDCGPKFWPNYYDEVQAALEFCASIGLGVHFSYGDLRDFTNAEEDALADGIADVCDRSPLAKSAIQFYEGLNEARDTGDRDDAEPSEIERFVNRFRRRHQDVLCCLSAFTGHEDVETLKRWTPDWQQFVLIHSYRAGHLTDKARHIWNESYELAGKVRAGLRTVKRGEPCGTGKWVSATDNREEMLDPDAMTVYLLAMALSAGTVTYFSSVGVIYDEPIENMAGFATVCAVLDLLPRDLGAGRMVHGGNRVGSERIYAVAHDDGRCDHSILPDGRFAVILHGRDWERSMSVREHRIEISRTFGQWGRLIVGRV